MSIPARAWLPVAGYWFLACEFGLGALTKYWPGPTVFGPAYAEKFVGWGYPAWFRFVVGGLEFAAAVALVIPRRRSRFAAAAGLVLVLVGAVTTHIINHDKVYESVMAPVHLVIMMGIALANWPADWRDLLRARPAALKRG
ncbi:DoxX family protein [Longispora sp. K20-0274]|uniref:DoxX family protein n=1 Tax=Longispora sp. K20-0274 TaxID=3088255 RepID=UPI00399960C9